MRGLVLALDVGNSRIKWALADSSGWLDDGIAALNEPAELIPIWDRLQNPDKIIGCNVAGERRISEMNSYWLSRGNTITWIQAGAKTCGVTNQYEQPGQLGSDRWAALIAAWSKLRGACLVVSAGTAMTIDALDDQGRFIGGQILPGRRLMQLSLESGTHGLKNGDGQIRDFPRNSSDAMASGISTALVSAIESVFCRLEALAKNRPACILTGGDADWLGRQLHIESSIEPKLVLAGLLKIAEEEA